MPALLSGHIKINCLNGQRDLITQTYLYEAGPYKGFHVDLWCVVLTCATDGLLRRWAPKWICSTWSLSNYCSWTVQWLSLLHRRESCLEAKNLHGQPEPHLESHGVCSSQEDPQRQLSFVGSVAPQAMRTSCHAQGCHQETEVCWKTQKQNTGCARGRLPLFLLSLM